MTDHVHLPALKSRSEIAEKAREFHPVQVTGRFVVNSIAFIFTALGWVVGAAWFAVVFSVFWTFSRVAWTGRCFGAGVRLGARVPVEESEKP